MEEEIKILPTHHTSLIEAYKRLMDYYFPKKDPKEISPLDGYFGGSSNSIAGDMMGIYDGFTMLNGYCYPDNGNINNCPMTAPIPKEYLIKPQGGNK